MNIIKTRNREFEAQKPLQPLVASDPDSIIFHDKLMEDLKSIADEYDKDLRQRATSYAEKQVAGGLFAGDEELLSQAKESLDSLYGDKKATAKEKYQSKTADLESSLSELKTDRARALFRESEKFDQEAGRLAEKVQKQGVSHSSVALLAGADLNERRDQALEDVNHAYDKKIEAVDGKLARLNASYAEALKNYELSYAVQLEKEIGRLQSKRDRLEKEYVKEHAGEKERAYDAYLAKERKENRSYEESEGDYTGAKRENFQKRYDYLVGALEGKTKSSVKIFIKQNETRLKEYLGLYYDRFVEEVT